jgi:hypothetical protein
MDTELLVDEQIEAGQALVDQLLRDGFDDRAVIFWTRESEEGPWGYLYIASAAVNPEKVGEAYGVVYESMRKLPDSQVSLSEIKLVHPSDPLAAVVIGVRDRTPAGRLPIRFRGKSLERFGVDEVYIYSTRTMFLVESRRHGALVLVFTWEDPRQDGCTDPVIGGVILDYDMDRVHDWPYGQPRPDACIGRSQKNPKYYKVFKYRSELEAAGFEPVTGMPVVFGRWSDYLGFIQIIGAPAGAKI